MSKSILEITYTYEISYEHEDDLSYIKDQLKNQPKINVSGASKDGVFIIKLVGKGKLTKEI